MDQAKKLLLALTPRQLATIAIVAIAVVAGVMGFSRWQRESGLKPLYTGLAPEDASAIVQKLHEGGSGLQNRQQRNRAAGAGGQSPGAAPGNGRAGAAQNRTHRIRDLRQNEFRHHRFRRARELPARARRRTGTIRHGDLRRAAGARARHAAQGFRIHRRARARQGQRAGGPAPGDAVVFGQRDCHHESGVERGGRVCRPSQFRWST